MLTIAKKASSALTALCALTCCLLILAPQQSLAEPFSFAVTSDMRGFSGPGSHDTRQYFQGVCQAMAAVGPGDFMVIVGDLDPVADVKWTIEQYLGETYLWYPVVGNHDLPGQGKEFPRGSNMDWLRSYNAGGNSLPHVVNFGPPGCEETTYSFDHQNAHFVVLNQYYDGSGDTGTDGDIVGALYRWLADDLAATTQKHIFVFGHEPAYPQPDADNGRKRHIGDSLDKYPDNRDRFWGLLRDRGVTAYICGHSHNYSAVKIDGVWQLDAGHARGAGDRGAPSTFFIIQVTEDNAIFTAYRDGHDGLYDYNDMVHTRLAVLPIVLSSFTARWERGAVELAWVTESAIKNRGFILQRREKETPSWSEIASYLTNIELIGQDVESNGTEYKYVDVTVPSARPHQYRVAVVSYEGQMENLGTVEIEAQTSDDAVWNDKP